MESVKHDPRSSCELCKTLDCCPEHCCNWDSCTCRSCHGCLKRRKEVIQESSDPSIFFKATGDEETRTIKKKEAEKLIDDKKPKQLAKPSEQTRAKDGALIINYEVPIEEDEDKVVYAGGIKGIRALRVQRDQLNEQIQEDLDQKQQLESKFGNYEERKKAMPQKYEESKH